MTDSNPPSANGLIRCSGPSRRRALQLGVGALGLTLPRMLSAQAAAPSGVRSRWKSVVILYLSGGPSQLDMWDLKPDAPAEIRGEFKPIETNVSGIRIGEHLPRMARLADKYAIVRSMTHDENDHLKAGYWVMTGHPLPRAVVQKSGMTRQDRPHAGAILSRFLGSGGAAPPFVTIPEYVSPVGVPRPGQHAGFLGASHDPYLVDSDPSEAGYFPGPIGGSSRSREHTGRLRTLLRRLEDGSPLERTEPAFAEYASFREKALDLVTSNGAQKAFHIEDEPRSVRERYGMHTFGQSALVARRLVEAGVRLVQVNFVRHDNGKGGQGYDSHSAPGYPLHTPWLRDELLPKTDSAFSGLIQDLSERGLLEETLVLMMGEFGRTPRFNSAGGRDHWARCYSLVVAGGGFPRGEVIGASDATASEPTLDPMTPEQLLGRVYTAVGIPLNAELLDHEQRPQPLLPMRG